jgi:uncharacterized protein YabE (DUF348 family)
MFWPVPVKVTVCGEPMALSAMFKVAVRVPVAAGVKVMLIWQLLPEVNELLEAQVLALMANSDALVPLNVKLVKLTVAVPVLLIDIACALLVLPTLRAANVREPGLTLSVWVMFSPVPVKVTVCGEPVALSAMFNVAVRVPVAAGVKVMLIWQLLPEVSELLEAQVLALMANSEALVPLSV